ncbi:hypothetical protein [Bacillus sp. T3]|uniref:hypothetical protein n=1 Tax=Bacillus sp. T3 TaxID=467262 RepID=UPI00298268B8|nr:hypothetical protein [Bacillus sp. T3]
MISTLQFCTPFFLNVLLDQGKNLNIAKISENEWGIMTAKWMIVCITGFLLIVDGFLYDKISYATTENSIPSWEKVNKILPKYSKFTVVDTETGMKFRVQRRAGSAHADVQPLSSADTKIMKKIYSGKWSWRRRSIFVMKGKHQIPASMHGMPHGAGALQNNFPGHFCIHFYGSTTHRTNHMDLSHKLMILKAAGKLESHLAGPDPYEVVNAFFAGLKEKDKRIASVASLQPANWTEIIEKIDTVRISQMTVLPIDDAREELHLLIPIQIDWFLKGIGPKHFNGNIEVIRFSQGDPWKVSNLSFLEQNGLITTKREGA